MSISSQDLLIGRTTRYRHSKYHKVSVQQACRDIVNSISMSQSKLTVNGEYYMKSISVKDVRIFILFQQDLLGSKKYNGKNDILTYFHKHKMIQFDPVNICGRNAEIVLFSRFSNINKDDIYTLLYKEKSLMEAYDKKLCIILSDDWGKLEPVRQRKASKRKTIAGLEEMKSHILNNFSLYPVQGLDLYKETDTFRWYWKQNASLARIAFEELFVEGKISICDRKNGIKVYELNNHYFEQTSRFDSVEEYYEWHILRRMASMGIVWLSESAGWDYIPGAKQKIRRNILLKLVDQNVVTELYVEEIQKSFFCLTKDWEEFNKYRSRDYYTPRLEFIAPLDSFIWDRNIIRNIFDFDYKWEIYIPQEKRQYCDYALPILQNGILVGRIEMKIVNSCLSILNIWSESKDGVIDEFLLLERAKEYAIYQNCTKLSYKNELFNL